MKQKTINMIIPYFGKFPNYFPLFLQSCRYNKSINWTILTDNMEHYNYPSNVSIVLTQFNDIVQRIQSYFNFKISLVKPYKLCDFKPAYGYLFPDLIEGYDYWGFCDLDVIYGDLRTFLTDTILTYPKIFTLGHFTLIQNQKKYNEMFMSDILEKDYYKKVYSNPESFNFDEIFLDKININTFFEANQIPIFKENYSADIYTKCSYFRITNCYKLESPKKAVFVWNKGKLYRYIKQKNGVKKKEYMYIHLQKRKMKIKNTNTDIYKIIPNAFCNLELENPNDIYEKFNKIKLREFNMHYFKIRFNNLKTKLKRYFI